MSHLTDDQLLQRYADGRDAAAFGELVRRHAKLVHATCRRETGEEALAEDATQAVFLLLARKAKGLRSERSLASWLFASARLASRNLLREERRRKAREARASALMDSTMSTDATPEWEELAPHLNQALSRLGTADRQAVILRYLEGRTLAEVAAELNLGENAARMRVSRAVERLRINLGRLGVAATSVGLVGLLERDASAATVPSSLFAVSVPTGASSGAGGGTWLSLAKGTSLTLATHTTKALIAGTVVLLAGGGFVVSQAAKPKYDDDLVRAAFKPFAGSWKGEADAPDGSHQLSPIQIDMVPEDTGRRLKVTIRFPEQHQGERKHLSVERDGRLKIGEGNEFDRFETKGLGELAATGKGTLDMTGHQEPSHGGGDVRVSMIVEGDRLTMRQEMRPDGAATWRRHEAKLERVK